jgi:hypothetical protein
VKREDEESNLADVGYDDIGGCRKQMAQVSINQSARISKLAGLQPSRSCNRFENWSSFLCDTLNFSRPSVSSLLEVSSCSDLLEQERP